MTTPAQIANRFCNAAPRYEQGAPVQREAAKQFDLWLAGLDLPQPTSIAEIGCGTGFFTRLLHRRYPETPYLATDLAAGMLAHCRAGFATSDRLRFQVADGRSACFEQQADWIVSTMCFQWFQPLAPVLHHHINHSRVLAFSILLDGSFSAWHAAHARTGHAAGLQDLPNFDAVLQACASTSASRIASHRIALKETHVNGLSFARSLRTIGADQARAQHRPVNLRAVCRQLENGREAGFDANYEIGFFCLER